MVEPNYNENDTQHAPSILGAMINPITQLKYQYLSVWAWPTYYSMMRSGNMGIAPFYMVTTMFPGLKKYGTNPFGPVGSVKDRIIGGLVGRVEWSVKGTIEKVAAEAGMDKKIVSGFSSQVSRGLRKYMSQNRWKSLGDVDIYNRVLSEVSQIGTSPRVLGAGTPGAITKIASSLKTAQTISRVGAVMTPVLTGIVIGNLVANAASLWFKGSIAALDYVNAQTQSMRNLEFGGYMGPGYKSAAAATERQRAVRELQRTPINATRFLGNEASIYAGLV